MLKTPPLYSTEVGAAYLGDSRELLRELPDASVNLVVTSPPFALHFKKEYGNVEKHEYVPWFLEFAREVKRVLTDDGSFVIDLGGAYEPGRPTRSLYQWKLLIALVEDLGFYLAQEFYWFNPGKMPAPAGGSRSVFSEGLGQLRLVALEHRHRTDNRKVLVRARRTWSASSSAATAKQRPSGHNVTKKRAAISGSNL